MMARRFVLAVTMAVVLVWGLTAQPASAQYPTKAVELVIHMEAGSAPDIEGRVFASELTKVLGKPIVPLNKPGGGGAVSYTYVKNAVPDGHTLAWNSMSILTSTNIGNVPFDFTAFDHVAQIMTQPMIITVRADAKWKTMKEFIADAKANPGKFKLSNSGTGSSTHLVAEAVAQYAGITVNHMPLGSVRSSTGLLSGEVDINSTVSSMVIDLVKAGKVRVLLSTGEKRMKTYPDVPTMKELGYDVVLELFRGVSVPKGTPAEVRAKIESAMMQVAKTKAMADLGVKTGLDIEPMSGADFTKYLTKTDGQIKDILKKAGLYRSGKK
ncbi:MAG: tripartite tricarboxylate transporter substrate binding protein [Thermodesulfobacteriota bacterium]